MVSTQLKVMFVDIPKTGSTSLKRFLIRSLHPYYFNMITDPAWMTHTCPGGNNSLSAQVDLKLLVMNGVRHEPISSIYRNTYLYIHECFIFSNVRNPFSKFKSYVIEQMLLNHYDLPFRTIQSWTKNTSNQHLIDPSNLFTHKDVFKSTTGWRSDSELLLTFLHITLNRIKNKGGFRNFNACDIDIHLWPQYMFFNLPNPKPLPIRIMSFENIEADFEMLKKDLSSFVGTDITSMPLPQADPIPEMIYGWMNPTAKKEMGELLGITHEQEWELLKTNTRLTPFHVEVLQKFPTYSSFIVEYKKIKQQYIDELYPILESDFRELIEEVYDEDYRLLGYEKGK